MNELIEFSKEMWKTAKEGWLILLLLFTFVIGLLAFSLQMDMNKHTDHDHLHSIEDKLDRILKEKTNE